MMYKIEGEDLYLIGTSRHTMIGRFIDQTLDEATLPPDPDFLQPLLPQGRKVLTASRRGIYRIHQFEKPEMIVVCRRGRALTGTKLWKNSVGICSAAWNPCLSAELLYR